VVLIAERAALLSGRDDEFVAVVTKGFTGVQRRTDSLSAQG
jgi:hypothetical protein